MDILCVSNSFPASTQDWVPQCGYFFVRQLISMGHDVTVVAPQRFRAWKDSGEIPVVRIPSQGCFPRDEGLNLSSPLKILAMMRLHVHAYRIICQLCSRKKFDIGIALWAFPSGLWLGKAKQKFGIPFVTWCLGADIWKAGRLIFLRKVVKKVLSESDYLYADGHYLAREVESLGKRSCDFLPTTRILPPPQPLNDADIKNRKIFFFVGRWEKVKGVDILIHAFAKARPKDTLLLIYGIGSQEHLYRRLVQEHQSSAFILIREKADAQTVSNYLSAAHCCVIPSRNESIPIVLSDAVQCQCPMIVADTGDMGDIVNQYQLGKVVPSQDIQALAQAINFMASRPKEEFRSQMHEAQKVFDIKEAAEKFIKQAEQIVFSQTQGRRGASEASPKIKRIL